MVARQTGVGHILRRLAWVWMWMALAGCGLSDPDIPSDHSSFRTVSLPACTMSVVDISGNKARLRVILQRDETSTFSQLTLCYSRQPLLPDLTAGIQDITALFNGGKDTADVILENLDYSSDYACRLYIRNKKETAYSDVIHLVTQPNASRFFWEKMGELPTAKDIYSTAFSMDNRGFVLSGQTSTSYPDTPVNPVLWEYRLASNTWERVSVAPFKTCVYVAHFVIGTRLFIGNMHNGDYAGNAWWCYDLQTNGWTRIADVGGAVTYVLTSFSVGGKGYLIASPEGSSKIRVYQYDPSIDGWEVKGFFPGSRLAAATSFVQGLHAYIVGGYDSVYRSLPMTNELWAYNSEQHAWALKGGFSGGVRAEMVSVSTATGLFVGFGKQSDIYGPIDAYDWWRYLPDTDTWRVCPSYAYWPVLYFRPTIAFELDGDAFVGSGSGGLWRYSEKQ